VFGQIKYAGDEFGSYSLDGPIRIDDPGILDFADKHGDILSIGSVHVETHVETWRNSIRQMRRAIAAWDRVRKGAARPMDRAYLQSVIGDAMSDIKTPRVSTATLVENRFVLRPVNLLAFMWLSFARVVSGEIEERRCAGFDENGQPCTNHVYIGKGPGLRRDDKNATCGYKCRKRKQRAALRS
jgi:hypothetical protein